LLPNIKWPDSYTENIENKGSTEKKFVESVPFMIIWEVVNNYFKDSPDSNSIIKIAGRSAEFQVINKLLLDNPNTKLEEIKLTNSIIVR